MTEERVVGDIPPLEASDREVGALLAQMEAGTRKWRAELGRIGVDRLRWQPYPDAHSIGAILLHIAGTEAFWLHEVVAGAPPDRERGRILMVDTIDQYGCRWPPPPRRPLAWYYAQQDAVRAETLVRMRDVAADAPCRVGRHWYTARRILHHVASHADYHGGQAALLSVQWRVLARRRDAEAP